MEGTDRYACFTRIKQTIREARDYLLVGVDVAKDRHNACFMRSSGEMLLKRFAFENTQEGFSSFLGKVQDYRWALNPQETVIGLETTGNYMYPLAQFLEAQGLFVVMVSSMVSKRNRDTLDLSWNKNDTKDAWNVADCLTQGKLLYYSDPATPYAQIRRLMNLYSRLSTERGHHKVRLQNNVLCVIFPEFTQVFDQVDELVPMTILEHFPLPQRIAELSEEGFVRKIVQLTDPKVKKSKLRQCHQLAKASVGVKEGADALVWEQKYILAEIKRLRRVQTELLGEVQRLCQNLPSYQLLQTVPGIGPILGAILLGEIGDIRTYHSSRQLLKLAGLDLAQIQSGQLQGSVHISKRGKPALRSALYQAALVAIRQEGPLRLKYLRLLRNQALVKGMKRKAIVATACKLLRVVYHVLKNQQPYQPHLLREAAAGIKACGRVGESESVFITVRADGDV